MRRARRVIARGGRPSASTRARENDASIVDPALYFTEAAGASASRARAREVPTRALCSALFGILSAHQVENVTAAPSATRSRPRRPPSPVVPSHPLSNASHHRIHQTNPAIAMSATTTTHATAIPTIAKTFRRPFFWCSRAAVSDRSAPLAAAALFATCASTSSSASPWVELKGVSWS